MPRNRSSRVGLSRFSISQWNLKLKMLNTCCFRLQLGHKIYKFLKAIETKNYELQLEWKEVIGRSILRKHPRKRASDRTQLDWCVIAYK